MPVCGTARMHALLQPLGSCAVETEGWSHVVKADDHGDEKQLEVTHLEHVGQLISRILVLVQ